MSSRSVYLSAVQAIRSRFTHAVLVIAGLFVVPGCGEVETPDRISVVPVKGQVLVNGEPASGAKVIFHPADGPAAEAGLFPYGIADESGAFAVTSYEQGDGAPPGEYKVSILWPDPNYQPRTRAEIDEINGGGQPPDKLRGKYAQPDRSGIRATITSETTELPAFDLK